MRISMISAALVAALVGYGSTIAIVLAAAAAVSASPAQTASWVLAICLTKAIGSAGLSTWLRVPMVLAWSTPGAALIAASSGVSMAEAVGAFVLAGLLIAASGLIRPLGRLIGLIPDGIASGMLAGVLLPFCLKGVAAIPTLPGLILPMVAVFVLARLYNPSLAVLAALIVGIASAFVAQAVPLPAFRLPMPHLTVIAPQFRVSVLLGLGVPLYLVTMASQNLPGFATLRAAGYAAPVRPALMVTGVLSALSGLFGAHTVSMAAITAALCLGDDVHPDRNQRWKVGLAYGAIWVCLGVFGPVLLAVLAVLPAPLIAALVGLALLGPLTGAMTGAFTPVATRFAAVITLVVTASGLTVFGIGAAFYGLLAGLAVHALHHLALTLTKR